MTALEVATASERDTDGVCELLTLSLATPHSHPVSNHCASDLALCSISYQGTHSPVMDSSAASDQIISISGQRRRRRRVPQITEVSHTHTCVHSECLTSGYAVIVQALWNLVNVSGQRIQQIFNQLDRRLKSADKKTQSGDRGQKATGKRSPDNQTTNTSTVSASTDKEQYTSLKAERDELVRHYSFFSV